MRRTAKPDLILLGEGELTDLEPISTFLQRTEKEVKGGQEPGGGHGQGGKQNSSGPDSD